MSEPRELRARGRNTKRRLLDAGAEVLATKGYHATRVDDVVKLAQTSHGTFYLYFSNKEELFRGAGGRGRRGDAGARRGARTAARRRDRPGPAAAVDPASSSSSTDRHGPVIRAWTEAEIGGSEFGRLGTDLLTQFTGVIVARIDEVAPPDLDPHDRDPRRSSR